MAQTADIIIEVMSPDELTDELIGQYYPMLSQAKKDELSLIDSVDERRLILTCEIVAVRAIARLNDSVEGRVKISCVPNGKSVVESGKGYLSVAAFDGRVCAAACSESFGFGAVPVRPFRFAEAQQKLSDAEIRALVAASGYSLMDIVNADSVKKQSATELYAELCAMKKARYECLTEKEKKTAGKVSFSMENGSYVCSDPCVTVRLCAISKKYRIAAAAVRVERG